METKHQNRLGQILLDRNLITTEQLDLALGMQDSNSGTPLGKVLVREKVITEEALAKAVAQQKHLDVIDLAEYEVDPNAAISVTEELCRRNSLIPIAFRGDKLLVAMANPLDVYAVDTVQVATGRRVELVVATEAAVSDAITNYFSGSAHLAETAAEASRKSVSESGPEVRIEEQDVSSEDVPVVKLANEILTQGFKMRASDVHIECEESSVKVRFRIDGVLREVMTVPMNLRALLISRFKIVSGMDIAERRVPQDGRMGLNVDNQRLQIRVASLPNMYGENITLRLLSSTQSQISLMNLGFDEPLLEKYRKAFKRSHGAIINTGPTGSGKTTTLYATMSELNKADKKIITIEDPIEYSMPGITQMQINRKAGLEFSTGLRAIVRADPDIVMVGEIRDFETAQMAIRAALTGHLVLSSLHTNDAASALTRLVDMGIDAFLVTSSVRCVLAQRLVRLLCTNCREPVEYSLDSLKAFGIEPTQDKEIFYRPGKCRRCQGTGHKGRIGLFEMLLVSDALNRLCISGASSVELKRLAVSEGMRTLFEDGVVKARKGLISIEEIIRVVA